MSNTEPDFAFPSILLVGGVATTYRRGPGDPHHPFRYSLDGARRKADQFTHESDEHVRHTNTEPERIVNCVVRVHLKRK
jgi:hypothetical protein